MAIEDIRVKLDFTRHPKLAKLESDIGPGAGTHLVSLWAHAAANCPSGVLTGMDAEDIALAARWPLGDAARFVGYLVKRRWLVEVDGAFAIKDWEYHQPWIAGFPARSVQARLNRAKGSVQRNRAIGPTESPKTTDSVRRNHGIRPTPFPSSPFPSPPTPKNKSKTAADEPPPVAVLPCKAGGKYEVTWEKFDEWSRAFPKISVLDEILSAAQWLKDNPTKAKTARGMPRFLGAWFRRANAKANPTTVRPAGVHADTYIAPDEERKLTPEMAAKVRAALKEQGKL